MHLKVQKKVSLKPFCTYRTGGQAKYYSEARSAKEMLGLREFAKMQGIPYLILGGGSNILFSDDGYPGLIIHNKMNKVRMNEGYLMAESGANMTKMLLQAAQHNMGGLSGLINVPGSVGGAIYGNAGIPDIYVSDALVEVTFLPENETEPVTVSADKIKFGYRWSSFKESRHIILSGVFKCSHEPSVKIRAEINQYAKDRALKQPAGLTCGSFFKNPGRFPSAGWLIEQSGCKGMQLGGAMVSEKHANWIMNTGEASSDDVINLALKVHDIVKKKFDVDLEPEVQIIAKTPFNK